MKYKTPLRGTLLACLVIPSLLLWTAPTVYGRPGQGAPLDLVRGEVYHAATLSELKQALNAANEMGKPATILIADGEYLLDIPMLHITCPGLVIRSRSGDRSRVTVRGPDEGPKAAAAHVFLVAADDVVLADMTFGWCRYHGIQVRGERPYDVSGLHVHNCRIVNCNEQFIKGSCPADDPEGATDGIAEHAVHFWRRCTTQAQNIRVERNWIINCDRGIGFGLSDKAGGHHGGESVIRNNMIYNDGKGGHTDVGIGLEYADHVRVENNTVLIETYWAPIEYRFPGSTNLVFQNNLVNRPIHRRGDAPPATLSQNLEQVKSTWFVDRQAGDLHLTPNATPAIDSGLALPGFAEDLDGQARPTGNGWDIGADEYGAQEGG